MNDFPSRGRVKHIREMYPVGTRIELVRMYDDPYPMPAGSRGTVQYVDDAGHIHMKWDNGRTLSLIWDKDSFYKIGTQGISDRLRR